jgi:hypothetical protein
LQLEKLQGQLQQQWQVHPAHAIRAVLLIRPRIFPKHHASLHTAARFTYSVFFYFILNINRVALSFVVPPPLSVHTLCVALTPFALVHTPPSPHLATLLLITLFSYSTIAPSLLQKLTKKQTQGRQRRQRAGKVSWQRRQRARKVS